MRRVRRFVTLIALAGLAGSLLAGCGEMPTAPRNTELAAAAPSKSRPVSAPATLGGLLDDVVKSIVQTIDLVGSVGGSVNNGRWTVQVPAGAVDGSATISISIADLGSSDCQLEIGPADKNHFSKPVILTVDCHNVPVYRLASYTIFWHDPTTGSWIPVKGSKVDLNAGTVSAPLQHFSTYAVGTKAGW